MAGLTPAEKIAGRQFKAEQEAHLLSINVLHPPTYVAPSFLGIFRHLCPARNNKSTAMELKEKYVTSPQHEGTGTPAGRFAYLYREGQCSKCGRTARSTVGRLVDALDRPPLSGRGTRS